MSSKDSRYNTDNPHYQYDSSYPGTASSSARSNIPDDILRPVIISTTQSDPIPIPPRRISNSTAFRTSSLLDHDEVPAALARRKREPVQFKEVQWSRSERKDKEQHMAAPYSHRIPLSPVRSSSSSGSKAKAQKENGILRRTSQSCRNKFQKAMSTKKRPSIGDAMDGVEAIATSPEPAAYPLSISSHKRPGGIFKTAFGKAGGSRYDTPQPINGSNAPVAHNPSVVPSGRQHTEMHLPSSQTSYTLQIDTRSGSAARKAAAASSRPYLHKSSSNLSYHEKREFDRSRVHSNSSAADSGTDLPSSHLDDVDMVDASECDDPRRDPLAYLPLELSALVFAYLDADSLRACQKIGPWKELASDPLIWRGEYLRNFQKETYVTPAPIQIGGVGVGMPARPTQNWQAMHLAREQINANWAAGRGRAIYMAGHTDSVYCVQFDEQKIITGSRDRTIRVWDLNTNRCIKVIGGPTVRPTPGPRVLRTVDYPSFHHAEPSVNGSSYGQTIYHVPSDFHSASILCLQYDEKILVTGSSDNDLIVWDINTFEPIQRLKQHQGGVLDVAFDEDHIVSCSKDFSIVVWDRKTLQPLRTLNGHNGPVNAVQLRGNLLVSASGDGVARLWDLTKMECVTEFPPKERGLAAVEFSDDAKYVLAGGNDHVTYKFDVATGAEVLQYSGHTQLVRSLFLDTQNKRVVSGSYDLDLRVYDYETGNLVTVFPEWTTSWMLAAKCDYRRIVSTSQDGRILMIDFGINQDGQEIPNVDLLRGCSPLVHAELDKIYPNFARPGALKS